ncbi:hypothetical protein ZIOFF_047533 [Zingiber officinale]|uniref:NAD(P)-binding domain-containing protein n=1 Tax=Zingiber officinale TaxID=94328 RepID=A0A8J5FTD0_ZINOF|nr:hypothetical protein ZIOFF_047533 [Zingiber officinale]
MNSKARELADRDEKAVITTGVPYTIIRTGLLQSVPSGNQSFRFSKVNEPSGGPANYRANYGGGQGRQAQQQ